MKSALAVTRGRTAGENWKTSSGGKATVEEGGEIHTGTLTGGKVKGAFHLVTLPRLRKEGEM